MSSITLTDDFEDFEEIAFQPFNVDYLPYDDSYELDTDRLRLLPTRLGEGHYGEVWLGCLLNTLGYVEETVAIKMPKKCAEEEEEEEVTDDELKSERKAIRDEIKVLAKLERHENIVELKGTLTKKRDHFWMALEYCQLGSLKTFLADKKTSSQFLDEIVAQGGENSPTEYTAQTEPEWIGNYINRRNDGFVTTSDLLLFGLQIANGMDFLHGNKILHRDLALRNILLTINYTIKIADFGLSRETRNGYYSKQNLDQAIPWIWTAPEVLKSNNSRILLESDLWTFGVVLWELFALGGTPYAGINARDLIDRLETGYRMAQPKYSPMEIYRLMRTLWHLKPQGRTNLTACQEIIRKQLKISCPPLISGYATVLYIKPEPYEPTPNLPPFVPVNNGKRYQKIITAVCVVFTLINAAVFFGVFFIITSTKCESKPLLSVDCFELHQRQSNLPSGIYLLSPSGIPAFSAFCDMETDGGGWTVFQRRIDENVSFHDKTWIEYKNGFNNGLDSNLWLGNDRIHVLSIKDRNVELRIDIWRDRAPDASNPNGYWFGKYTSFSIDNETNFYTFRISSSSTGNASISLFPTGIFANNGMKFSTIDVSHDNWNPGNCSGHYRLGGWWLNACGYLSLNGKYNLSDWHPTYDFSWNTGYSTGDNINPERSRMMLRKIVY